MSTSIPKESITIIPPTDYERVTKYEWLCPQCQTKTYGDARRDTNDRLIAAAPELLEACKAVMAYYHTIPPSHWLAFVHKAQTAITKATEAEA